MHEGNKPLEFTANDHFSLGVEVEFQILDKETLDLVPLAPKLLKNSPKILSPRISEEFIRSILELQTGICHDVKDVENDLMQTCSMAEELAVDNGCILYASSLHPFAKYSDQVLTEDKRYKRIMAELQLLGRQFISQGLHVHVGLKDGDTAIRVCNILQLYLPLLLSLSTSSPFSNGIDTGLLSYRTKLFEALPMAGLYSFFEDWNHFTKNVEYLKEYGVIGSIRDLWWDARPNPHFGTIEIRVCDLPGRFTDILALVAMIQALVAYISIERKQPIPFSMHILQANKWQAVRHGLDGHFIDATGDLDTSRISTRKAVELMLEKIRNYAMKFRGDVYLDKVQKILDSGTSAVNQRKIYKKSGSFKEVIAQTHREFWQ